jgi:hypothetical protein
MERVDMNRGTNVIQLRAATGAAPAAVSMAAIAIALLCGYVVPNYGHEIAGAIREVSRALESRYRLEDREVFTSCCGDCGLRVVDDGKSRAVAPCPVAHYRIVGDEQIVMGD